MDYHCTVLPDWIDYNGHMRDAYYGLIFSYAVDALQDAVGLDADYRGETGCTVYLVEDHKVYLHEVSLGQEVVVETRVLDVDPKRFHLHMTLMVDQRACCIGEFLELHVQQKPHPRSVEMPGAIRASL